MAGTLAAARHALERGVAMNLGGGTHHAGRAFARGYCLFNDVVVTLAQLRYEGLAEHALVVDCDVHQGDGTADLLRADPHAYTLSLHGARNYPFQRIPSDLDVDLPTGTGDADYLEALDHALDEALYRRPPEIAFYLAGADPWEGDRLGRLSLTKAGLRARDALVLDRLRATGAGRLRRAGGRLRGGRARHRRDQRRHRRDRRVSTRDLTFRRGRPARAEAENDPVKRGVTTLLAVLTALIGAVPAEAAPEDAGQWSAPQAWPRVAVHTSLLPTGKVLFWDGFEAGPNSQHLFDPLTGQITAKPYSRNLFCSGFSQLADGRLFIAGGHVSVNNGIKDSTLWDPNTSTATRVADMQNSRWYPTVTTLPDGRALVFSGDNISSDDTPPGNPLSFQSDSLPEVYNPATNTYQRLTGARLTTPLYPFMFVLPDGRVFDAGPDPQTHLLDVSGNGTMSNGPVSPFDGSSAVMYAPGKVMKSGTWSDPAFAGRTVTGRTAVIDMNQPSPVWRETAPMHHPRSYETITSLPDGTSIVTGGTSRSDGVDMATAVLPAEIWNPETETWTEMAAQVNGRGYHSTALLLPDGRVLSAGGGQLPGYPVTDQRNAEIFSPPYLFKGPRPTVLSAPSTVQHGSSFNVGVLAPESIAKVSMVRLGSQTHTFDQNQRYIPLNFTNTGGSLNVQAPANSSIAPPGYYMLFVLNGNGVPSMAEFVRMPAPNEDATAPTAPANLTATGGLGKVDLTWSASTDNGSIRRYNVHRSTTPGFTPTAANRVGQPTGTSFTDSGLAGGTYHYMVQAEDQAGNLSTPSAEASATATGDSTAPTVSITAPADGATVQASVNVTANAADAVGVSGVQFKLDGANLGGEDTSAPYSVAWDTTATANGAHSLSAVARDAAGNTRTATTVNVNVSNTGPPPGAPVAAYGFDEASGPTVSDASGATTPGRSRARCARRRRPSTAARSPSTASTT